MPPKTIRFNPLVSQVEYEPDATPTTSASSEPTSLIVHPALHPDTHLRLDFSLPSAIWRADRRLDPKLLSKPACTPPQTHITIRIAAVGSPRGLCVLGISSCSRQGEAEFITVGDVLTTIHDTLRQQLSRKEALSAARRADVQLYRFHRVSSVGTHLEAAHLSPLTCREVERAEAAAGVRRVDLLCGAVMFDGIVVKIKSPAEGEMWLVDLMPAER